MLSGEGNENLTVKKTTIGLISNNQLCTRSTLFLYISLPLFFTTTMWSEVSKKFLATRFMAEMSYAFMCFSFFFPLPLAFLIFSSPLQNFDVVFPTKSVSFVIFFLSLALALCRSFPRWASLACRLLSPFLCLSLSLFSKFVAVTINLSLILWQHGCRNISAFVFIDSLVVSASQDVAGHMRFQAKIT